MNMKYALFAFLMLVPVLFANSDYHCSDFNVSLKSVTPVNGRYNWSYTVCDNTGDGKVNYLMIETCICSEYNGDVGRCIYSFGSNYTNPNLKLNYTYESHLGLTGLKFYDLSSFTHCKTFWFVTYGDYAQNTTHAGLKIEEQSKYCNYTVQGPEHTPPITAPEFPSIAVPFIVAAGAATFVYALRKTS